METRQSQGDLDQQFLGVFVKVPQKIKAIGVVGLIIARSESVMWAD